jgi:hypothetical protein
MPSLSFFVDEHDLCLLLDRLNADPEIAFIVPDDPLGPESKKPDQTPRHSPVFHVHRVRDGDLEVEMGRSPRQRWKAVRVVDTLNDGEHSLWHVPAGRCP